MDIEDLSFRADSDRMKVSVSVDWEWTISLHGEIQAHYSWVPWPYCLVLGVACISLRESVLHAHLEAAHQTIGFK